MTIQHYRFARPLATRACAQTGGFWSFLLGITVLLMVGAATVLGLYAVQLDHVVRSKFEGKRWALPARVYARPLELYQGRVLTPEALVGELQRLKYLDTTRVDRPGTYQRDGERVRFYTHGFRFWDGAERAALLEATFADGQVATLATLDQGPGIALARLDPALIASIYPTHNEDRVLLTRAQLPELLVKTLLAVEDRNFYQHLGVDPKGILRAAYKNFSAGRTVEGASTLTQQLVKNFYLNQERTLKRKINEALMALLLDLRYSKDEILTAYANEVYMGQDGSRGIHGFGLASRFYFDRSLSELGPAETALLVAVLKGPSEYNPRRHPEKALERRNLVLDIMAHHQIISLAEAEQAKAQPLGLRDGGARPSGAYPAFVQLVRRQLQRDYREEDLRSEGLKIFTTLDPLIQTAAEQAIRERLPQLEKQRRFPPDTLESAAVVTSVAQGEVLALVGGRNVAFKGFNRALDAVRSIGSAIKPVIYLTALERPEQYSLVTSIPDRPVNLRIGNDLWQPNNYDHRIHGQVPLYRALAKSYNLAAVNLGLELGVDEVAQTLHRLGVTRPITAVPAMLLGSVSLAPIEVAQVYQTIAAGGFRTPLRAIREVLDASGRPLTRYPLAVEPVARGDAAFMTQWAMRQVVEQGTATWLKQRLPEGLSVAGKTGTTNDLRDSWFAGFSGDKVTVVWVGRDNNQSTRLTGSSGALRVWGDLMASIDNQSLSDVPPEGVVMTEGCGGLTIPVNAEFPQTAACPKPKREAVAQSDPSPEEAEPAAPLQPPKPKPKREDRDSRNLFLSDFYGN
ncbi:penicillin-binding protein 1B [Rhabdochromatium marinum]|uniref:penicillin-binding protein 1B n=1 Tax=Rhabdochromatium marinum TaxID=48729 RepID=UPI001906B1EA|nr:penicillin-binding protein 1B [Rhabdochromatium marinum]MBK1650039.1 penicillin-binding protein 1B [Rhabdochromatium marinum]